MASIKFEKVEALPATLTLNTCYMVKNGQGFDLFVSDALGETAVPINAGSQTSSDVAPVELHNFMFLGA